MDIKNILCLILFTSVYIIFILVRPAPAQDSTSLQAPRSPANQNLSDALHSDEIPVVRYDIISKYPHDVKAFTQGLVFSDGFIYEGTGIRRKSSLRRINPATGDIVQSIELPDRFFGEGITVFENRIIQLTWQSRTGFVYDRKSLKLLGTFQYATEGWGITHNGRDLIMSDGSADLYFLDSRTYKVKRRITVRDNNGPVPRLNELEYIRGEIYANVWRTHTIAIINPETGRVTGWLNLEKLSVMAGGDLRVKTLNGIAYDETTGRLFITGKLWPWIYEIKLSPATPDS